MSALRLQRRLEENGSGGTSTPCRLRRQKTRTLVLGTILFGLCSSVGILIDNRYQSFASPPSCAREPEKEGPVVVALLGDSWATDTLLARMTSSLATTTARPIVSRRMSIPGARTGRLYRAIRDDESEAVKKCFDCDVDYVVFVCGVNDVITHSGAKYYAHHVECLIRHSRARGIQPIVVEIPAFGARDTSPEGIFLRMRALLYRFLFDHGDPDPVVAYRRAFEGLTDSSCAVVVKWSTVMPAYPHAGEHYSNSSHLDDSGYRLLGDAISRAIGRHMASP